MPATLNRHTVVTAAIRIADTEGLPAVSLRRIAADLGVRTMTLYTHITSKDDLLHHMRDRCDAQTIITDNLPTPWRAAIQLIATRAHQVARQHPWMINLTTHAGPNALRHLEQSLQALTPLTANPHAALHAALAIDHYVLGHTIANIPHRPTTPYTRAVLDTLPTLAPLLAAAPLPDTFDHGLNWLLDGLESAYR